MNSKHCISSSFSLIGIEKKNINKEKRETKKINRIKRKAN
jgi:hypothetical protein